MDILDFPYHLSRKQNWLEIGMYINNLSMQAFGFQFESNLQFAFGLQCEICFQQRVFGI
jgi:hypothetical protein